MAESLAHQDCDANQTQVAALQLTYQVVHFMKLGALQAVTTRLGICKLLLQLLHCGLDGVKLSLQKHTQML